MRTHYKQKTLYKARLAKPKFKNLQHFPNKRARVALNRSPVLIYVIQSCSVEGNDLNHLLEGNQAGLFCSIVFERITRPTPSPTTHKHFLHTK